MIDTDFSGHYMRAQCRGLMLVQIAAVARGEDLRGDDDAYYPADKVQTVGKMYGQYVPLGVHICEHVRALCA